MKKKIRIVCLLLLACYILVTTQKVEALEKYAVKINVTSKKYGAKSGKDATKEIQKALDDAAKKATNKKRALVQIPKGTYYLSKTLKIDSNVHLKCDKKTVITKKSKSCLWLIASKDNKKGKYNGVKNITIEGGTWDAKYIKYNAKSSGSLLYFVHGQNIEFLNMTIKRNYGTHLIELGAVKNVTIKGCKLYGFKKNKGEGDKEAIQLDIAHSEEILPGAAPYDDTPCKDVVIENNEIYDYPRAIGTHAAVDKIYYDNVVIRNNNIHDIREEAVYVYNYTNLTVENNVMENVGSGVVFKTYTKGIRTMYNRLKNVKPMSLPKNNYHLVVRGNKITTTKKGSKTESPQIGIYIYGNSKYTITGCTIVNNVIESNNSGIVSKYAKSSKIENNSIRSQSESGIQILENSGAELQNNNIRNASQYGVLVKKSTAKIANCEISNTKNYPISITDGAVATVLNTKISNGTGAGINILGGAADITGCTIEGTKGIGIWLRDTTRKSTMKENRISNSSKSGIKATKSTVQITGNVITQNKENGVGIYQSTVESMADNKLSNPNAVNEIYLSLCKVPDGLFSLKSSSLIGEFQDACNNQISIDI